MEFHKGEHLLIASFFTEITLEGFIDQSQGDRL